MKQLLTIFILITFLACSSRQQSENKIEDSIQTAIDSNVLNQQSVQIDTMDIKSDTTSDGLQTSTYDNNLSDGVMGDKKGLKELSDKKVFSTIHDTLLLAIGKKHQDYFDKMRDYELLSFATGDLFQSNKEDYAFIVYDKKNTRISILVYDELRNKYFELFRNMKVKNGLMSADCNYGAFGTLDFQLAGELLYQQEYLVDKPKKYLESPVCKIVNISKDEDFVLDSGCFSKIVSKSDLASSLCFSTSSVYNNWECLKYDRAKDVFIIFYGQAFAD